jgi:MoaA/NifB/PqqE/SkfB family radical SAM enzyme
MTDETQDDARTNGTEKSPSFREQLDNLEGPIDTAIEETLRKIESGRVYDAQNESVRIKRKRALGYLVRTKLKVIEARELEELEERLSELEATQNGQETDERRARP